MSQLQMTTPDEVLALCNRQLAPKKIEQLRNRPEKNAAEKCRENHAVAEELKKQMSILTGIRKSDNLDTRIEKIGVSLETLQTQTKPLKKTLNPALYLTDSELMELVAQTTQESLMAIGGGSTIDPVDVGKKIASFLEQLKKSVKHYKPDTSEWCDEWKLDEEDMDEHYNDIYGDSARLENHQFASRLGYMHKYYRELLKFSRPRSAKPADDEPAVVSHSFEPAVFPFNTDFEFMLQLVEVVQIEKPKKVREKVDREKKKEVAELVKVNDKASNVQSEEVSISNELQHVLKILKKELKNRKTDGIGYYEFVTNPNSFSRTVENMFYISYLMRDREVFLIDVNGIPTLKRPSTKDENTKKLLTEQCSWHGVTSLSHEQWVRLSRAFKKSIIEPLDA